MIPLTVDVPMKRWPWINWGLILVTILVSLAVPATRETVEVVTASPANPSRQSDRPFVVNVRIAYSPLVLQRDSFEAFQLVTALLQHGDVLHLLGNMLFLFIFGNAINAKLGHLGFLACYFGIGTAVNLIWLAFGGGEACLGASAAVMGLCGMFLILYPLNNVTVFWDELAMLGRGMTAELPGWAVIVLYLAFDILGAVFDRDSNVYYVGHIGGGVLGIGLAAVLLKLGWLTADRGERTLLQCISGEESIEHEGTERARRRGTSRPSSVKKKA